jgi:hypothetical protein
LAPVLFFHSEGAGAIRPFSLTTIPALFHYICMAYTIEQQPGEYSPAFNPLTFVVRESNNAITGQDNFRYVCEVEVGGTVQAKLKAPIRYGSTQNEAVFDITEILASYVGNDFEAPSGTAITKQPRIAQWRAKFGYEYGSGVVTEATGVVNSAYKFSWDACLPIAEYNAFQVADYLTASGGTAGAKFLTDIRPRSVQALEQHSLTALYGTDTANKVVEFKAYSSGGTLLETITKSHTYTDYTSRLLAIDCTFTGVGFTVNPAYYTVQTYPSGYAGKASEAIRFNLWEECSKYDPVTLHFLNTLGGFDSYTFRKRTIRSLQGERKTFEQDSFRYTTGAYNYSNKRGGVVNYNTTLTEQWVLNTDWLTDEQVEFIEQLLFSPVVYMGSFSALEKVTLNASDFERKYNRDGLVQYSVTINRALKDRRQRL